MIAALDQTRKDAKKMRESIRSRTAEFEEARRKAADLMKTLTQRATSLEKLKARVRFQAGVVHFFHLGVGFQEFCALLRVLTMTLHSNVKCFHASS